MGIANGGYNNPFALVGANPNIRFEILGGLFFTNGGSQRATATLSFAKQFTGNYYISPMHSPNWQSIPYSDTIFAPQFYNLTTSGFTCQLTASGNLGTVGSPANLVWYFLVIGS